jgi:hypothetical protein
MICPHDDMIKCFRCSEVARLSEDNRELVKATGCESVGGALLTIAALRAVAEAARAVAREHDRYLSDEVGPMGRVDEAMDDLRTALAALETR